MNQWSFDRLTRDLAGVSTRRRFLGLAGVGAGSLALAGVFNGLSRTAEQADAQDASPTPTAIIMPSAIMSDGRCGLPFELAVRQGPSEGTEVRGMLVFSLDDDGTVTGALLGKEGEVATVTGQAVGQAVALRFDLGGEDVVFGSGSSLGEFAMCNITDMGGSAVGPKAGDLGDWRQGRVNLLELPEPICIQGQPCPTEPPERPEPTRPLPPDITSCDPLSAESCVEVCGASGLAPSASACVGYCAEVLQC
ncbi:MAG: twin-arginine translocation signal domain-containing protein [Thermomicrobiales bacterium]